MRTRIREWMRERVKVRGARIRKWMRVKARMRIMIKMKMKGESKDEGER